MECSQSARCAIGPHDPLLHCPCNTFAWEKIQLFSALSFSTTCFELFSVLALHMDFTIRTTRSRLTHSSLGQSRLCPEKSAAVPVGFLSNSASLFSVRQSQYHPGYPPAKSFKSNTYAKRGEGGGVSQVVQHLSSCDSSISFWFNHLRTLCTNQRTKNHRNSSAFRSFRTLAKTMGGVPLSPSHFLPFQILQNSSPAPSSVRMESL